ncbi:hypothetical protein TNCV_1995981 [Trichonephila clavipes]|uniref:Uncharacterized protein n=1 Tax=Trichonephila clavipes TaxID=2585209 RepID=A0A8X6RK63_TRICX|nr:hypothetical protein TNCV_1995981 [Trichonephila clavipes]
MSPTGALVLKRTNGVWGRVRGCHMQDHVFPNQEWKEIQRARNTVMLKSLKRRSEKGVDGCEQKVDRKLLLDGNYTL